jgi:hypothetical protein
MEGFYDPADHGYERIAIIIAKRSELITSAAEISGFGQSHFLQV